MLYRPALHGNWNALSLARRALKDKFPTRTVPLRTVLPNHQVFLPDPVYAFRPQNPFCVILPVNSMGSGVETMEVRLCCLQPRRPDGGAILRRYRNSCVRSSASGCIIAVLQGVRWVSSRTFRHTWHISVKLRFIACGCYMLTVTTVKTSNGVSVGLCSLANRSVQEFPQRPRQASTAARHQVCSRGSSIWWQSYGQIIVHHLQTGPWND